MFLEFEPLLGAVGTLLVYKECEYPVGDGVHAGVGTVGRWLPRVAAIGEEQDEAMLRTDHARLGHGEAVHAGNGSGCTGETEALPNGGVNENLEARCMGVPDTTALHARGRQIADAIGLCRHMCLVGRLKEIGAVQCGSGAGGVGGLSGGVGRVGRGVGVSRL